MTALERQIAQFFRAFHRIAVQIESTALSDLSIGLFAHDFDVTEDEVVRGGIRHGDGGIAVCGQMAAAGDLIAFEVNITQLGNEVAHCHITGHMWV